MIVAEIETQIEKVRFDAGLSFDEILLKPAGDGGLSRRMVEDRSEKPSLTFGEAYERYLNDPTHTWSVRTKETYETSRKLAVSVIGAETLIKDISRSHLSPVRTYGTDLRL
jgi:hypothetical protein